MGNNVADYHHCVCVQVLWLPSDLRALVQEIDPELQQTSGSRLPLDELQSNHIVKLNLHYSSMSTELIRYTPVQSSYNSSCYFFCNMA